MQKRVGFAEKLSVLIMQAPKPCTISISPKMKYFKKCLYLLNLLLELCYKTDFSFRILGQCVHGTSVHTFTIAVTSLYMRGKR